MAALKKTSDQSMRALPTWLLVAGMIAVFLGERMFGAGPMRWFSAVGAAMVLFALVLRGLRLGQADAQRAVAERSLLLFAALGVVALVFYGVQSDLTATLFDKPIDRTSPKLAGMLTALWPVLVLLSLLPTIFVEVAWGSVARAPKLEVARIRDAALTGLGLAGALTFAFSMVYVATQRDVKFDLSYFRTAKAGESTHKIVQALDQELDVSIFYPPANEVREEVESYFSDLKKDSPLLKVSTYDNAVDLAKAKELNVTANGMVVISRGGRKETLSVGLEQEAARSQLRNLDKEVQKRFLQVARPGHTFYLTTGHGERAFDPQNDTDKRATLRDLREVLQSQSYAVRTLGVQDGLGVDVPNDATIVAIVGPQQEFAPEEIASHVRYLDRGGRLFVALDPDYRADATQPGGPPVMKDLMAKLGLRYDTTPLANDSAFAQRTHQKPDRQNIVTAGYSSHPSVSTLSRMGGQAPLILVGAGHLEEVKERAPGMTVDFTVRAHPQTFVDPNRDFDASPGEQRKTWELAAAVKRKLDVKVPEMAK